MVLLIIIPTKNGYFIGGLDPIFRQTHLAPAKSFTTNCQAQLKIHIYIHMVKVERIQTMVMFPKDGYDTEWDVCLSKHVMHIQVMASSGYF